MEFIDSCRSKIYPRGTKIDIHHIQPEYDNGLDEDWNLIPLSLSDHWKAHYILLQEFGNGEDARACCLIQKRFIQKDLTSEEKSLIRKASGKFMKKLWSNPDFRSMMCEKISKAKKKQFENPKAREIARRATIKYFEDPTNREKTRRAAIKYYETTDGKLKTSKAIKKKWENSEYKEKCRAGARAYQEKRRNIILAQFPGCDKVCSECNQGKMYSDFYIKKASFDGYQPICKKCTKIKNDAR